MLIRFTGGYLKPDDVPAETRAYGYTFPVGVWVVVTDPAAIAKLGTTSLSQALQVT